MKSLCPLLGGKEFHDKFQPMLLGNSLTHSLTHSHTHSLSLSLARARTHTHTHARTHTGTHTDTQTHSFSLSYRKIVTYEQVLKLLVQSEQEI
jgi:hypothetical protein